jgi:methylamine---corrinoid protein Co-methyltransferase
MSRHRSRLVDVLQRAESGPLMEEAEFERKLLAPTVKSLIEKFNIKFDKETIVSSDDDLADRVFQAGMECAVEVGLFCQSTSRRMLWTQKELEDGLYSVSEATMGLGNDAVTVKTRRPEDDTRVIISGGAYGIPVPEDLYIPMSLSYLREPLIDITDNPSLLTVYGHPIKAGSPWEVLAARREAELALQAAQIAGRAGISLGCVELSPTCLGALAGASWGGYRPSDWHHVSTISELKTNYDILSMATHITKIGGVMETYYNPIYGGYVGGAEGVAIALVAGLILIHQATMPHTLCTRPNHPFLNCDTTPELIWATGLGVQALSRNSNTLPATLAGPVAGPGTKTILYENSAFTAAMVASGVSVMESSHSSSGGSIPRHGSGLDSKICAEVTHAVSGKSREEANELVKKLIPLYEVDYKNKPFGKPFEEVYDIEKIEPTAEWQGMYDDVLETLSGFGLNMNRRAW